GFIRRRRRPRKVTGKLPTSGGSDSRWGSRQQFHAVLAWVIKILTLLPAFFDPILLTPDKKTEWKETRVNESIRKGQAPGRRRFDAVAAIALLAACGTHAAVNAESTYPEKPVRM